MRKPKGTIPGRLAKVVSGKNFLANKVVSYRRYFFGIFPGQNSNPQEINVVAFKSGKPCTPEFSVKIKVGTVGMILEGKRTKANTGAVPYFIILIENQLYKIDSNCIEFIE